MLWRAMTNDETNDTKQSRAGPLLLYDLRFLSARFHAFTTSGKAKYLTAKTKRAFNGQGKITLNLAGNKEFWTETAGMVILPL